ncbi:MAG: chaperone modulator CbpM [Ferruginibacter sp.]
MNNPEKIKVTEFCTYQHIEISFVRSLQQSGLIELTEDQEELFVDAEQLQQLEKLSRLHYDMDINLPGLESIHHLLKQMDDLQQEIYTLRTRLSIYE